MNEKVAMLVGSTLLTSVKVSEEIDADGCMFWLWICGLILMWWQSFSPSRHTVKWCLFAQKTVWDIGRSTRSRRQRTSICTSS